MNSLEALIALTAIIALCGALTAAISQQNELAAEATNSLKAKALAIQCSAIIDSIYSNTAREYAGEISCIPNEKIITAHYENKSKTVPIITTARKELFLEVDTLEHYIS